MDGHVYTVAPYRYLNSSFVPVMERIVASASSTADVMQAVVMARPKTLPIAWNANAASLTQSLQTQPGFGQVHVERTLSSAPSPTGYVWTVTFLSNVGDQPSLVANPLNLLGVAASGLSPAVAVSTVHQGVQPDNYMSRIVTVGSGAPSTPLSTEFHLLTTGLQWYFRVLATNDMGDGPLSTTVTATPAAPPGPPSALTLGYASGTSLLATYPQDAASNGSPITAYQLRVTASTGGT